jgi:hypothetical protein
MPDSYVENAYGVSCGGVLALLLKAVNDLSERLDIQLRAPPFQSPNPTTLISPGGAIKSQISFIAF